MIAIITGRGMAIKREYLFKLGAKGYLYKNAD